MTSNFSLFIFAGITALTVTITLLLSPPHQMRKKNSRIPRVGNNWKKIGVGGGWKYKTPAIFTSRKRRGIYKSPWSMVYVNNKNETSHLMKEYIYKKKSHMSDKNFFRYMYSQSFLSDKLLQWKQCSDTAFPVIIHLALKFNNGLTDGP